MPRVDRRVFVLSGLGGLALRASGPAFAQEFPNRPITLVVPYAAGGPTDAASRVIAQKMGELLDTTVIIENRPGASTILGATYVAGAPKDGYTLLMVTTTTLCTNPHLYRKITYKVEDFEPVAMTVKVPIGVAVKKSLPVNTIGEFHAYVKQHAGTMNYGSAGTGANSQLVNELMNAAMGIKMTEVPYKGTAPALTDLVAGVVDVLVDSIGSMAPLHKARQIKILGNFDSGRSPVTPDVPTFAESGFPDLIAFTWNALMVPAGTPKPIIDKLNAATVATLEVADVRKKLEEGGFIPQPSTPAALAQYIRQEYDRWGPLIRRLNIRLD